MRQHPALEVGVFNGHLCLLGTLRSETARPRTAFVSFAIALPLWPRCWSSGQASVALGLSLLS
jgi:hypothetical protein